MIRKIEKITEEFALILKLYKSVRWEAYTSEPEQLKKALINSDYLYGYYQNDELLGVIRGLTDDEPAQLAFYNKLKLLCKV